MNTDITTHIDATGLTCPVPLMLLKKAIHDLPVGAQVIIEVTDVHAELDFEIWCERFGHGLKKNRGQGVNLSFTVTIGSAQV